MAELLEEGLAVRERVSVYLWLGEQVGDGEAWKDIGGE